MKEELTVENVFVIIGPTASGKTKLSIELAKFLNGEIISADSMQIYKKMNIGSAKVTESEMKGIPHYLIDIVEPEVSFNVSQYKKLAEDKIKGILSRGKLPMVVGGTGLYINSLICNYDFTGAKTDEAYRVHLMNLVATKGKEYVHKLLEEIDPDSYNRLYPNDVKRVIRALEVYKLTGITISDYNKSKDDYISNYNLNYFVLTMDREKLYSRINQRVDIMIKSGLIEEVQMLKALGYTSEMQSMKGIGYKEMLYYLEGKISKEAAIDLIKKGSRNYAKRQLTWFRKDPRVKWICKDDFHSEDEIIEYIISSTIII